MAKRHDVSFGYHLPRRGSTIDQANNDSYSRIDDGDTSTCWKSNPYLDSYFTGDDNNAHPQWICIDFRTPTTLDTVKIQWGKPYATDFTIEGWIGEHTGDGVPSTDGDGVWKKLCGVTLSRGEQSPDDYMFPAVTVRYLRVVMRRSAGKPTGAGDPRDQIGYAIREIYAGTTDKAGTFTDKIVHGKANSRQTWIMASSADPWHTAADIDKRVEQPSFDRVFASGLTRGQDMLMPVAVAYDTPENAAAELQYVRLRNFAVTEVELGEEPDGQYLSPEDYGALFVQFARALKAVDPAIKLGGPSFQTAEKGWRYWPDAKNDRNWLKRFLAYMDRHGHIDDFTFFSFEWYPFDDTGAPPAGQLLLQPQMMRTALNFSAPPRQIPWYMTEFGYSAFAGQPEVSMAGALMNADIALTFLSLGGQRAYLYGYEPAELIKEQNPGASYGNLALFLADGNGQAKQPFATYYGARLLTRNWLQPGKDPHRIVASEVKNSTGRSTHWVVACAVARPDGALGVVLINKDPARAHIVRVVDTGGRSYDGPLNVYQYSSHQYAWHPAGENGFADPDLPPVHFALKGQPADGLILPPFSMTVLQLSDASRTNQPHL